jgi:TolA-binding protein
MKRLKTSAETLGEFERDARTLEKEKLSEDARAAWERLREQIAGMQKAIRQLQEIKPFSPQKAGQRIVCELQNAEGGAVSGGDLKSGCLNISTWRR